MHAAAAPRRSAKPSAPAQSSRIQVPAVRNANGSSNADKADEAYRREIPDDEAIATAFSRHRARRPEAYAAPEARDLA